jgi:hypothetical protein
MQSVPWDNLWTLELARGTWDEWKCWVGSVIDQIKLCFSISLVLTSACAQLQVTWATCFELIVQPCCSGYAVFAHRRSRPHKNVATNVALGWCANRVLGLVEFLGFRVVHSNDLVLDRNQNVLDSSMQSVPCDNLWTLELARRTWGEWKCWVGSEILTWIGCSYWLISLYSSETSKIIVLNSTCVHPCSAYLYILAQLTRSGACFCGQDHWIPRHMSIARKLVIYGHQQDDKVSKWRK